jgi:uncharacterized protein YtpQ (UPF0354 family)
VADKPRSGLRIASDWSLDAASILPVIKRTVKASEEVFRFPEQTAPVDEGLAGELFIMYAFDLPGRFQFVSRRDCERLGLTMDDLRALSVRNLIQRRPKPKITQAGRCALLTVDGDLDASLLLVDTIWEQFAAQVPGDPVAAVPVRNQLLATGSGVSGGIDALRNAASYVWQSPRANPKLLLTPSLLTRQGGRWELLDL